MDKIPVAAMVLLLGVDRFICEARAIGNAVGTMAIASWVGALDRERMHRVLNAESTGAEIKALYEQPEPAPAELTIIHKASA